MQTNDTDFTNVLMSGWIQTEGTPTNPATAVAGVDTFAGNDGYSNPPTAVDLLYLEALPAGPFAVEIKWHTVFESVTAGFNIYRSEQPDGPSVRLNVDLISASGLGEPFGTAYTYIDRRVNPGVTYYYRLEHISTNLMSSDYGQVSARNIPYYLPLIAHER